MGSGEHPSSISTSIHPIIHSGQSGYGIRQGPTKLVSPDVGNPPRAPVYSSIHRGSAAVTARQARRPKPRRKPLASIPPSHGSACRAGAGRRGRGRRERVSIMPSSPVRRVPFPSDVCSEPATIRAIAHPALMGISRMHPSYIFLFFFGRFLSDGPVRCLLPRLPGELARLVAPGLLGGFGSSHG